MTTGVGIIGAPGKMATRLIALLAHTPGLKLAAALARPGNPAVGENGIRSFSADAFSAADVWIEFASAHVTRESVLHAQAARKPIVICTTGHDADTIEAIRAASKAIPVLLAPNTSLGVAVLNAALKLAVKALGPGYAAEIVELHHDKKKDSPSGTAMRLVETIKGVRGGNVVAGREGLVGPRKNEEIGVFAVRGGNVIGEHTVYLIGEHDRLELTHRAQDRDLFAQGALRAAAWLAQKAPGAYTMEDCLELQS